jgi:hypothetical protein
MGFRGTHDACLTRRPASAATFGRTVKIELTSMLTQKPRALRGAHACGHTGISHRSLAIKVLRDHRAGID